MNVETLMITDVATCQPHDSMAEAARAIVVRNDPNEQEHVILYEPSRNE